MIRTQFADIAGDSELAVLAAPTEGELAQLTTAVAIMTAKEKENARVLSDQQVQKLAEDAKIDPALMAIFINGYVLECRRNLQAVKDKRKN